jgi:hypothetical protein
MSPCRILGPMTFFRATCRNLLYLAGCDSGPRFKFESAVLILEASRGLWTFFPDDLTQIAIFSKMSIRAFMTVMMAYSDPLQKDEINEYKVKNIQTNFYFWQYVCAQCF